MPSPDVSALSTAFSANASVFGKAVLDWDLREQGIQVRVNVKAPQPMAKLSAGGKLQPYRKQDDFNNINFTNRVLTAYQGKYDFEYDPEEERNTYLTLQTEAPFAQFAVEQSAKQYLDTLKTDVLWLGVRNAAGTDAVDLCNGWGTIIASEITATNLTPIVTGAITGANAVTKLELVADGATVKMKKGGFLMKVSFDVFGFYATHYRTLNGFQAKLDDAGRYKMDNRNVWIEATDFMGNSQRVLGVTKDNMVFGTDVENVQVHSNPHLNILQNRLMMPAGCEFQDLDGVVVNEQV